MRTLLSLILAVSLGGATLVHGALPSTLQDRQYQMFTEVSGLPAVRATAVSGAIGVALSSSIMDRWFSAFEECSGNPCLRISVSGGIAPTDAQYWVGAANATLTAEKDLSGFTALVLNTAGTPSAYAGATSCTNQFFTGLSGTGASTCTTATLASAQFANQGTTTTVLHGNAAGNPSWASVVSADLNITTTTCGAGDFINAISATAGGTCATPAGGGASLDAITAAVADQAGIANADWNIRWNWAKTTNNERAFETGESAASTGGTLTNNAPNQVILAASTLATSTASPFAVYVRGAFAFGADNANGYLVVKNNIIWNIASAGISGISMSSAGRTDIVNTVGGNIASFLSNAGFGVQAVYVSSGRVDIPGISSLSDTDTGIWWAGSDVFAVSLAGAETVRWSAGVYQASLGSANATGYAINCRKSRGTVAAPTVITTGDDTCGWYGIAYVGATNTYQTASYILQDTGGTISDSATGVGGLIDFYTAIVGAEPALRMRIDNVGHLATSGTAPTMGTCGTGPSVAGNDNDMLVTLGTAMGTSCAVNFAQTWATNAPVCHAQSDTDIVATKIVTSTTVVTVTAAAAFTDSGKLHIRCRQYV